MPEIGRIISSALFSLVLASACTSPETETRTQSTDLVADLHSTFSKSPLPFPFDQEAVDAGIVVGSSFGDYMLYWGEKDRPGNRADPFLHSGVDFRVPAGTPVFSGRPGIVELTDKAFLPYHNAVKIHEVDDQGRPTGVTWEYAHLDRESFSDELKQIARDRVVLPAGSKLGRVVEWHSDQIAVADDLRYDHIHVNLIVTEDGQKTYVDPLPFIERVSGKQAFIEHVHFVDHKTNEKRDAQKLSGKTIIVAETFAKMDSSIGQPSAFKLAIRSSTVSIRRKADGKEMATFSDSTPTTIRQTDLGTDKDYLDGLIVDGKTIPARGDRFGHRSFRILSKQGESSGPYFDTTTLDNGHYDLTVTAYGTEGHLAEHSVSFFIDNVE